MIVQDNGEMPEHAKVMQRDAPKRKTARESQGALGASSQSRLTPNCAP
jgi:hypothetical protein